jgi:uncharacterized protein
MSYEQELGYEGLAVQAQASERAAFMRRTYGHLAGAILAFVGLEALLLQVVTINDVVAVFGTSPWMVLVVFLAFWGVSYLAQVLARSETSRAVQYAGLGLYVVAEAVIFLPLMLYSVYFVPDSNKLIATAGILTLSVFGGLTLSVLLTRKDFTYLAPILCVGGMIAFGVIIAALVCGFSLGLWFSFAMVALIAGFILFETSHIMLYHRTDQHVAAALMLFSSVATLFWYVLRILIALNGRD